MRVVVEGTPSDAAGILWIGCQLVMNTCVTNGVFGKSLDLIDRLRWIGVADKLCIEITGMIRRLQREAEVVHREHVFQEFRVVQIADASGLTCGIELMREGIGARIE